MKIKTKLLLGVGLLFAMVIAITIVSALLINRLTDDTKKILVANYNSIDYSRIMLHAFNNDTIDIAEQKIFADNLKKQQQNITETGEQDLTDKLAADYLLLSKNYSDINLMKSIRNDISDIMLLNMQAIKRKEKQAETTAENAITLITLVGTVCFIIALVLFFNLPGNIANPIKELTSSIKQIAQRNYSQRVHFEKKNEFGDLAESFNTMAEKLEEFQASSLQKLMIEKKRIETLINNMNDPVIGLDDSKKVLFMNDVALKISGLKTEEVAGKPIQDIAVNNDLIRSLIQDLFADNKEAAEKIPVKIYADNKESYFEKEIIPIKIIPTGEKEEKLIGNVIFLQNITPYKELDFAKTNFIATVSHELKTPIASIKMSSQLLENKQVGELNEEQLSLVQSIKEDAGRLLKITGELLNMTQVETGTIQLSALPASPKEIIDYAVNANKTLADEKNIKLQVSVPSEITNVLADKDKTAWVLTNLISNAIRYSYDNSVVRIEAAPENNYIKFSVTDTGQGIEPQYVNKIFDRYFRIPGTKKEGTGLGLSISKEFIEAQGGTITVQSEFGAGSIFSFSLTKAS
ncbi:MAG: HAMP domain-containing protein [Sphingobacteriales bacterium]|nr:HAMP domain-containing protein [Sphingobacteriales bacterium]MBI3717028.1 HAMP domain-containing protein [Sphingobacteriales bacterium]